MKKPLLLSIFILLSTCLLAQKKTVEDYYLMLKPSIEKKLKDEFYLEGMSLVVKAKDLVNGYMKIIASPEAMGSPVYDFALWRDDKGNPLIGIFEYTCGGMGCGGGLNDFKFFNGEMQEITAKVVDLALIKDYFMEKLGNDLSESSCMVAIPQQGTSIKILPQASHFEGYGFNDNSLPYVELIYNRPSNSFRVLKK